MSAKFQSNLPSGYSLIENRSDFGNLIGPIYSIEENNEEIFGFRAEDKHINIGGYVHGGMLSSFADIVMGQFANRNYNNLTVTINMSVDFLNLAKKGDWVNGISKLMKEDKKFVFLEVEIYVKTKIILFGTGVFKVIKLKDRYKGISHER